MARLPLVTEAQVSPDLASVHQKVASTESSMATTYQAILEQHLVGGELLEGAVDECDAKESGNRHTINLSNLGGSTQLAATDPAPYMVDMAKAEPLGVMGETEKAAASPTAARHPPSAPAARPSHFRSRNVRATLKPVPLRRLRKHLPGPWWYRQADRTPRWTAMPGPCPARRPRCREFCGLSQLGPGLPDLEATHRPT